MNAFLAILGRDLRLSLGSGGISLPVVFFLLVATLYPFAVGPDGALLAKTGGGVLWVAALLAALLPIDRLIAPDAEAGVLDQYAVRGVGEEMIAAAKITAHWIGFGPPLMLAAIPASAMLRLDGETLAAVRLEIDEKLHAMKQGASASMIVAAQRRGGPMRLFLIYPEGNFIEATEDTPYFQIGESKYGKPILDRVITRSSSIAEATKCALISMDSTIRSNLSVGLPLDLVCVRRDALKIHLHRSITAEDEYFRMIRSGWSDSLRHAFHTLPNPTF